MMPSSGQDAGPSMGGGDKDPCKKDLLGGLLDKPEKDPKDDKDRCKDDGGRGKP